MMKLLTRPPSEFQQEITISYHIREHANIAQVVGFSCTPFAIVLQYYPEESFARFDLQLSSARIRVERRLVSFLCYRHFQGIGTHAQVVDCPL